MSFDVPKVVRNPGCDHGHDEDSRNGRDIKIDILEAYIWISESFRVKSAFYRSTGRLPEPPGGLLGLHGPRGRRGKEAGGGRAPLPFLVRIGQGKGGGAPPFLPLFHLFPPTSPSPTRKEGSPTPGGSRTPPLARPPWPAASSPLDPLYTGVGGHPIDTQVDLWIVP